MPFRSGFVSIIGRPNAGKSTLLNALVGEKLAIVTRKPQTTRNRIQGIVNVERKGKRPSGQIVLIDTPGVHKPINSLNRRMMKEVYDALEGCDLLLLIVDATAKLGTGDEFVLDIVKRGGQKTFLLLNKVDALNKQDLLPLIAKYQDLHEFAVDMLGPVGLLGKTAPQSVQRSRWLVGFLRTRASTIGAGTREIQLNTIAEQVLDLPRDPGMPTR